MSFITIAGEQLIAKVQAEGKVLNVDRFILAFVPDLGEEPVNRVAAIPASNIHYDGPVTRTGRVNDNQVVHSLHLDTSVGPFKFNWIGLASGETLIAVTHLTNAIEKIKTEGSKVGDNMTRNFLLSYSGAATLQNISVDASTWMLDYSAYFLDMNERLRLSNQHTYGEQTFFDDGFLVSLEVGPRKAMMSSGRGFVAGIEIHTPELDLGDVVDKDIWLEVSLQPYQDGFNSTVKVEIKSHDEFGGMKLRVDEKSGVSYYSIKISKVDNNGNASDYRHRIIEAAKGGVVATLQQEIKKIDDEFADMVHARVLDKMFPIGDYKITRNSLDPSDYGYPGTWKLLEHGFSLRSTNLRDMIGKHVGGDSLTLGSQHLPSFTATVTGTAESAGNHNHTLPINANDGSGSYWLNDSDGGGTVNRWSNTGSSGKHTHNLSGEARYTNNNQYPLDNVPLSIYCYVWERVA